MLTYCWVVLDVPGRGHEGSRAVQQLCSSSAGFWWEVQAAGSQAQEERTSDQLAQIFYLLLGVLCFSSGWDMCCLIAKLRQCSLLQQL